MVTNNINNAELFQFTLDLLRWNAQNNHRIMPWKGEKDPYRIWLSEIILQQTRVEQGLDYYNKFIENYPTVFHLANANDENVFKLWEGLGYYSRCKNLLITARKIAHEYQGIFPKDYNELLNLKGIGPYTAAAIASFAYNLPHAVVDGNVQRILSRYFGMTTPIDSTQGKKLYQELATALMDPQYPGIYNQAIMDFGATVCKPQIPLCETCVLNQDCQALALNVVNNLPVKEKSIVKKNRFFHYFLIHVNNGIYIRKRIDKDIWENLYEFLLIESPMEHDLNEVVKDFWGGIQVPSSNDISSSTVLKQKLTHLTIHAQFHHVTLNDKLSLSNSFEWVSFEDLNMFAWPKIIQTYLKDKSGLAQFF